MHVPTLHFTISAVRIRKYGSLFFNVDVLEIDWRLMSNELSHWFNLFNLLNTTWKVLLVVSVQSELLLVVSVWMQTTHGNSDQSSWGNGAASASCRRPPNVEHGPRHRLLYHVLMLKET